MKDAGLTCLLFRHIIVPDTSSGDWKSSANKQW